MYFDNAATSYPKAPPVQEAMCRALQEYGGNAGRGGHQMSLRTAEAVYRCRERAAALFGLSNPSRVVFTAGCTASLNIALKSLARHGRVIVSDMEHNSVMRPLVAAGGRYPAFAVARVGETAEETVANFRRLISRNTVAIACLHASNVFGNVLPIAALGALAREHGLVFLVDAAQTAGVLPIDMQAMQIDLLCAAGHKGLGGPAGIGLLLCGERYTPHPLLQGGSGSESLSPYMPLELPERLESGTLNTVGICGLSAAIAYNAESDLSAIYREEMMRCARLYDGLKRLPQAVLYTPRPAVGKSVPLFSFNLQGKTAEKTAALLDREGVAVRAGLHCAPAAHRHYGTLPNGTVRMAPSRYTTPEEWQKVLQIIYKIS
ncbi:MAG: aminotransferase class V-fold PLP-dependent enzyme [Ruminococcaceae bacterium]|nr:aminotransferase class V-fold PLP-dependent enzyme [Oscillospiraceae bacterium]